MSEIMLRADDARSHAQDVRTTKNDTFSALGDLRGRIEGLTDSFRGRAQEAFIGRLDEWKASSDDLLEALEGLGDFLTSAADTIESVDADLASQLG